MWLQSFRGTSILLDLELEAWIKKSTSRERKAFANRHSYHRVVYLLIKELYKYSAVIGAIDAIDVAHNVVNTMKKSACVVDVMVRDKLQDQKDHGLQWMMLISRHRTKICGPWFLRVIVSINSLIPSSLTFTIHKDFSSGMLVVYYPPPPGSLQVHMHVCVHSEEARGHPQEPFIRFCLLPKSILTLFQQTISLG